MSTYITSVRLDMNLKVHKREKFFVSDFEFLNILNIKVL